MRNRFLQLLWIVIFLAGVALPARAGVSKDEMIASMVVHLKNHRAKQAALVFADIVKEDINDAELIYWNVVRNHKEAVESFALCLVNHYKLEGNMAKTAIFYKELLNRFPSNVDYLLGYADAEIMNDRAHEAYLACEQIAVVEPDNVIAHIFLGNYLYLQGERRRRFLDKGYADLKMPTSMQYAEYRDQLLSLFKDVYEPARIHLQVADRLFPSPEVTKTLQEIGKMESEVYR